MSACIAIPHDSCDFCHQWFDNHSQVRVYKIENKVHWVIHQRCLNNLMANCPKCKGEIQVSQSVQWKEIGKESPWKVVSEIAFEALCMSLSAAVGARIIGQRIASGKKVHKHHENRAIFWGLMIGLLPPLKNEDSKSIRKSALIVGGILSGLAGGKMALCLPRIKAIVYSFLSVGSLYSLFAVINARKSVQEALIDVDRHFSPDL